MTWSSWSLDGWWHRPTTYHMYQTRLWEQSLVSLHPKYVNCTPTDSKSRNRDSYPFSNNCSSGHRNINASDSVWGSWNDMRSIGWSTLETSDSKRAWARLSVVCYSQDSFLNPISTGHCYARYTRYTWSRRDRSNGSRRLIKPTQTKKDNSWSPWNGC